MDFISKGLIVSVIFLVLVILILRYEKQHAVRFGLRIRQHADFFVLVVFHRVEGLLQFLGRDALRQGMHYLFHAFLRVNLLILRRGEKMLQNVMRVNKTLAKNAVRENVARTKLEEIALHKVEHALTDDEKRAYKDQSLNGL